jgi:hypothetical protein
MNDELDARTLGWFGGSLGRRSNNPEYADADEPTQHADADHPDLRRPEMPTVPTGQRFLGLRMYRTVTG